jgi:hypothetical protein
LSLGSYFNNNNIDDLKSQSDKKSFYFTNNIFNKRIFTSLKNLAIRNSKNKDRINNFDKTPSELSLKNKKDTNSIQTKNTRKYYISNQTINFYESETVPNSKKNDEKKQKNYKKIVYKKSQRNKVLDKDKISKNIYNSLDKIQKKLDVNMLQITGINNNHTGLTSVKNDENEKINDSLTKEDFKRIFNKYKSSRIFNIENAKYDSITIKSNTSINFFPKKISKTIFLSRNNTVIPKRLRSTKEIKSNSITGFLERKKINEIPITFPVYLSHNNIYISMSEKSRVDRILSKLICLKTHLLKDGLNKFEIIKEFLIKNGIKDSKYFTRESLINLYNYFLQPFTFPPEYLLIDIINDGIKFNHSSGIEEINKIDEDKNILNYMPKNRSLFSSKKGGKKTRNILKKINSIDNITMDNKYLTHHQNSENIIKKALPNLIKDLEFELRQIKQEKIAKLDKYNDLLTKKMELVTISDKNKYVPNLCLISKGFKEKYKENIDKMNRKIIKSRNRQEKLKEINNRLYYDIFRKNNSAEFDRVDIQRKTKLTEFVVMEMAKKKYLFENVQNNYVNILKRINKNKSKK